MTETRIQFDRWLQSKAQDFSGLDGDTIELMWQSWQAATAVNRAALEAALSPVNDERNDD